jgi:hypothetical protein
VLLASPSWKGGTAGRKRVIRGESSILGTLTRTQVMGSDKGLSRAKEIQQGYKLHPLSTFLGTAAPARAPAINWPAWTEGDETREAYWSYVNLLCPDFIRLTRRCTRAMIGRKTGRGGRRRSSTRCGRRCSRLDDARAELKRLSEGNYDITKFWHSRQDRHRLWFAPGHGIFARVNRRYSSMR